ncbi:MAG: SDR family NAD(P)-dependent oxidoreductase, partial [Dehalococcoidia bacterium]|nr:SDR family NAD(P)-dependent oxidoreductase [Dehalococcoidia bacterium]
MPGRAEGKVAIVAAAGQTPGATIGNGRATAILLAREGASVVVADRDLASAEETVAMIADEGGTASACEVDATSEESLAAMVAETVARYGGLDILHNNVGASVGAGDASPMEMTEEGFDNIVALNLKSHWLASRQAIPAMRERGGGSIVNISSMAARHAYP